MIKYAKYASLKHVNKSVTFITSGWQTPINSIIPRLHRVARVKLVYWPIIMTTAWALSVPPQQLYVPLGLVVSVPCTISWEQWVALLTVVVVNLSSEKSHSPPRIPRLSCNHAMPDESVAHSKVIGSSLSPIAFSGFRISAPVVSTTTDTKWQLYAKSAH